MNIFESINAVMNDCGFIGKTSENTMQKYKFRGIDAVMNALNPALIKNKVFVVPEVMEQTREERTTTKGGLLIYSIIKVKYTFYAEDGSSVTCCVIGEGMDSGDKASNKAMSAAFKYACFQTFCIPTEEMKDADYDSPDPAPKRNNKTARELAEIMMNSAKVNETEEVKNQAIGEVKAAALRKVCEQKEVDPQAVCDRFKVERLEDLTEEQHLRALKGLEKS